jgi:hypothetical protein
MHPEAEAFIYNYLEPYRTTGEKIFDSILNDWGFYQSREMTYITEWLDAYFVKAGILLGFPFFYSVVFYLFIALASYIHYQGCRRYLGLSSTTSALILGIFWFSPSIFASGYLFRTAKIGAAACIIVMAWSLYALLRHPRRSVEDPLENTDSYSPLRRLLIAIGLFALAFIASLYDRQGFFMMIIFWIITTLILILGNQRYARLAFFSIGGAIALAVLWNQILSPTLILYFNGYIPDMAWQRITQNDLLRYNQEIGSSPFFDGLFVFTDILRFVIGNFGTAQILILILLALAYTYTLHTPAHDPSLRPLCLHRPSIPFHLPNHLPRCTSSHGHPHDSQAPPRSLARYAPILLPYSRHSYHPFASHLLCLLNSASPDAKKTNPTNRPHRHPYL